MSQGYRSRRILAKPTRREVLSRLAYLEASAPHDKQEMIRSGQIPGLGPIVVPAKRKKRAASEGSEHKSQAEVIRWWSGSAHRAGACLFYKLPSFALYAVPNGGRRDVIGAANLKAEGVRAGIPDLSLDVPRGAYHGLKIEMKFGRNTESDDQLLVLNYLKQQGYATATCYSAAEAIAAIEQYLNRAG